MRIAVVVPGVMGSALAYEDTVGRRTEIWGSDIRTNYSRLLSNSTLLNWDGKVASGSLIETFYLGSLRWPKLCLWKRLLRFLERGEFQPPGMILKVGYDWRRSLLDSAVDFARDVEAHANRVARQANVPESDVRFTFLAHSMGGLLVRCAIGQRLIKPERVDRIIQIGTPLEGSPAAFQAAYKSGRLPLLRELSDLIYWKNSQQFHDLVLENLQTFPSMYQLMPPKGSGILFYSPSQRGSPFDNASCVPPSHRQAAIDAHSVLRDAERIILGANVPSYTIHTSHHAQKQTPLDFRVRNRPPDRGYEILEVVGQTSHGDGTVPKESARGGPSCRPKPVISVAHATMCNDKKVVGLLPTIL